MHMPVQKSAKHQRHFWPLDSRSLPPEPQDASGYFPSFDLTQRKQSFKRCMGDFYRSPSLKRKAGSPNLVADQFQKPSLFDSNPIPGVLENNGWSLRRQHESLDLNLAGNVTVGGHSRTQSTGQHQAIYFKNGIKTPSYSAVHVWQDLVDGTGGVEQIASQRDNRAPQRDPAPTFALENFRSDASTPSVSNFPLPPHRSQHTPPTPSEGKDEPKTPTVYHFRGASFEFVNPRHSLQLQDIETPAERDQDRAEYFPIEHKNWPFSNSDSRSVMPSAMDDGDKANIDRRTPPRSLFNDLQSAYQSITSRPLPVTDRVKSSEQHLFDSPTPISAQHRLTSEAKSSSSDNFIGENKVRLPKHPTSNPSFRQRCSPSSNGGNAREVKPSADRTNLDHSGYPSSTERFDSLAEAGSKLKNDSVHDLILKLNSPSPRSTSKLNINSDEAPSCDSNIQGTNQADCQVSSPRNIEREHDSTDDLIASYGYNVTPTIYRVRLSDLSRHRSLPTLDDRASILTVNKRADSTIGEILDQYNRRDTPTSVTTDSTAKEHGRCASTPSNFRLEVVQDRYFEQYSQDRQDRQEAEPQLPVKTTDEVRAATARALATPASAVPKLPLPTNPPSYERRCNLNSLNITSDSSSPTSHLSYGDTNQLLLLSPASLEDTGEVKHCHYNGRHVESHRPIGNLETLSQANESSTQALDVSSSWKGKRTSQKSLDDKVKQDIKYLRQLSGSSDFHGSVYLVVGNGSSVAASDEEPASVSHADPTNSLAYATRLRRVSQSPGNAICVPVAAFQQSAVVPGIFRLDTPERDAFEKAGDQRVISVDATNNSDPVTRSERQNERVENETQDGEDEVFDWETLPESRATLHSQTPSNQEFDEWSSCESGTSSNHTAILSHCPDSLLPSQSRIPHFSKPLLQKAAFQFGNQFRAPNQPVVLSTNSNIYNTYTHPVPLSQNVENPFTSSPPQITGSRSSPTVFDTTSKPRSNTTKKENEDIPLIRLWDDDVFLGQECVPSLQSSLGYKELDHAIDGVDDNESDVSLPSHDSSTRLKGVEGPEFSLEAENGSPAESNNRVFKSRCTKLSSGIDPGLIHALRQGDHRMGSSPLSRSNSFAKLTHLGPKSNLTGTPNGTGMREVGSSLVGSSPLGIPPSSSPRIPRSNPLNDSKVQVWRTPVHPPAIHEQQTGRPEEKFPPGLSVVARNIRGNTNFRDVMMAQSRAETISFPQFAFRKHEWAGMLPMPRRSVDNLSAEDKSRTEWDMDASQSIHMPITPDDIPNVNFPKLLRRYRSPSSRLSTTRDRKQRLSWVFFWLCSIFPYLLILYGHGLFDAVMAYWTDGEIEHCGRRQKTFAKVLGWGSAIATILIVVILLIVVKTVPNDYSR